MSTRPSSTYGKSLPRKCAVIRRTYPEGGDVEKTELRFVEYRRPSGELDGRKFFAEVSSFLQEQMEDMDRKRDDSASQLTEASKSTHHQKICALRKAIPSLERLVQYYTQMTWSSTDTQYSILKMTVEAVLADVQKCLVNGVTANNELLERIRMLNKIQMTDSESTD